ncbi:MAG: sensor histidine kinase, partial [Bacteroidota bacterium]
KNPLNFVNNFAEISIELAEELADAIKNEEEAGDIIDDLKQNARHITKHGRRAASIVNSMMQHASGSQGTRQKVEINDLIEEYINLAYHGMRARSANFNTSITQEFDKEAGELEMVPQEIGRVLINLFNNAFFAMQEKVEKGDTTYEPELTVKTVKLPQAVEIHVQDNGPGIPKRIRERVFEPFFTTKAAGSGTGLGLSLSFDIITQGHNGLLQVESTPGSGTTFKITLPSA